MCPLPLLKVLFYNNMNTAFFFKLYFNGCKHKYRSPPPKKMLIFSNNNSYVSKAVLLLVTPKFLYLPFLYFSTDSQIIIL